MAAFERAVRHAPNDGDTHYQLGLLYRALGWQDLALVSIERAAELSPIDHRVRLVLGGLYMRRGRRQEGRQLIESAERQRQQLTELHSELVAPVASAVSVGSARDHYHLGLAHALKGETDAAIREFRRSIEINSERSQPHTGLGMLLLEGSQPVAALEHLQRAAELEPDNPKARVRLGWALRKLERFEKARNAFEEAGRLDSLLPEAPLYLAHTLFRMGQVDDAVRAYHRAIVLQPEAAATHRSLGAAYAHLDDLTRSAVAYTRALELEPDNPEIRLALVDIYRRLGKGTEEGDEDARRGE